MDMLTSIGSIDTQHAHHISFALLALEHKHSVECQASYFFWKSEMLDEAVITQQRADFLMNQIMHLKCTSTT